MKVFNLNASPYACNSYFVTADGRNGVLIDCGDIGLADICKSRGWEVHAVLLTHGHFDHVTGCAEFYNKGVPVFCGAAEGGLIFCDEYKNICPFVHIDGFEISRELKDGEKLSLGGLEIEVLATPGHSKGSVSYIIGDELFSGDTLFAQGFGRYDFYGGNLSELIKSIKKLFALEKNYTVYSGHGGVTTLERERASNPINAYMRG